jgi:hypothetical protein
MTIRKILAAAAALSLIALPAMAQTSSDTEKNGHHYQGGPKTEVPHHMGKKETVGAATKGPGYGRPPLPRRPRDVHAAPHGRPAAVSSRRWCDGPDGPSHQINRS